MLGKPISRAQRVTRVRQVAGLTTSKVDKTELVAANEQLTSMIAQADKQRDVSETFQKQVESLEAIESDSRTKLGRLEDATGEVL